MKKFSLFLSVLFSMFLITAPAQSFKESYQKYFKRVTFLQTDTTGHTTRGYLPKNQTQTNSVSNPADVNRWEIGKSANVYSILHSEQRNVFYSERTNSMHFAFISDPETYTEAAGDSSLAFTYSEADYWDDSFDNWEDPYIINPIQGGITDPSAVMLNRDNSNNLENLFAVVAAPHTPDGTNWTQTLFASFQLDEDNYHETYLPLQSENDVARSCMTVFDNDVYIFGQDYENIGDYARYQTLKQYRGVSDDPANGFDWDINAVSPDWLMDPEEGFAYALYTTWSAWSSDANIGYMWMIGVTNESYNYGVFQPQVYYTLDRGDT